MYRAVRLGGNEYYGRNAGPGAVNGNNYPSNGYANYGGANPIHGRIPTRMLPGSGILTAYTTSGKPDLYSADSSSDREADLKLPAWNGASRDSESSAG